MLGKKIHFEKKGFTLIEMLVVAAIIVLLTGIIFMNYRQGGTQLALNRSANKLAQDIRRAEEMAMSTREYKGIVPTGGYGIYLTTTPPDQNHYILFADCNVPPNYNYDSVGTPCNGQPEKIEDIKLESGVTISLLSLSPLNITFTPPNPTVKFNNMTPPTAVITLQIGVNTKTVSVNNVGLIIVN